MNKFRIIFCPLNDEDLFYEWDITCRDVEEAKNQASAYLGMSGTKYKSALVLSPWKSQTMWRQAIDPIVNNFNL